MIFIVSLPVYIMMLILKIVFVLAWIILKYTFFLMPLLVIKGAPIFFKLMILMIKSMMYLLWYIMCIPFMIIKAFK